MSQFDSVLDQIDGARIVNQIEQLAGIGALETGGITRLAFSREDKAARDLLIRFMREAGLTVRRDAIGNLIGTLPASAPDAPMIATGSHIDTVVHAGKLDGVLGTLAAVECARVIHRSARLRVTLEVICFVMEESARFGRGYGFGSRAMIGQPISDAELFARDRSGILMARAIQELKALEQNETPNILEPAAIAQSRQDVRASRRDFSNVNAFVELHIEQGPVLERLGKRIGIVTAVAAPTRLEVIFTGEQNHSGTTPMDSRRDALAAAAEAILAVERIAQENAHRGIVGTVGVIEIQPGSINVIPGRAEIRVDLRGTNADAKRLVADSLTRAITEISIRRGVQVSSERVADEQPVPFSPRVIRAIDSACERLGVDAHHMPSGAGHDAAHLAQVTEAGMIFVPSIGGISHDPREATASEDIRLGVQVLLASLLQLSEGETSDDIPPA